jgi:TolB protein
MPSPALRPIARLLHRTLGLPALAALAACGAAADDAPPTKAPAADAAPAAPVAPPAPAAPSLPTEGAVPREPMPGEKHLRNIRQLTFGGENAEAYWSFDGKRIVFQSTRPPYEADQIFTMNADGTDLRRISTGTGRTTCAYYLPGDQRLLFASTHLDGDAPPPPPDQSHGYTWAVFTSYEIFTVGADGKDVRRLTTSPGYDAEGTVSPKGDRIAFTSSRDGDLEVYTMALDGTDVKRITATVGYDGGPVWSPDGQLLAYRGGHPKTDEGRAKFKALLDKGLVRPNQLDLFVSLADGTNRRQLTDNGKANFGPFFTPDGKRLIFSSNLDDPKGRSFDLYLIGIDGTGLERVTFFSNERHDDFDGFPMFSPDGKQLVWCSNRHNAKPRETNVFVADWVD